MQKQKEKHHAKGKSTHEEEETPNHRVKFFDKDCNGFKPVK
jgi:hypothetical protein